jgi:thiol-disulfide isomerase/thioredoxin
MSYASYSSLGKDPTAPSPESMAEISAITSQDHRTSLINKYRIVLIDNYTDWCGPCKAVTPLFAQLAQKYQNLYPGHVVFVKENVEDDYGGNPPISGVPCFHYYLQGKYIQELTVTGGDINQVEENLKKLLK